jgi:diacylglycerol kinase family enzyme
MKEDTVLIMNPSSKNGKGKNNWKYFEGFEKIITTSRDDAIKAVINSDKKIIVAVGGDGTINQCVNGIVKSGTDKVLGVLYSGTSPDFCKFHGIPYTPTEAVLTLKNGNPIDVDVCKITTENGEECYFSSSCNIGLGAKVAWTSNKIRKYFGDFFGTLIALIYSLLTAKPFDARIKINDEVKEFKNLYHLFVIKNNYIASGLKFGIDCKSNDGKIFVVPVFKENLFSIIRKIIGLYKGDFSGRKILKHEKVLIETEPKQYLEFDGDSYPMTTPIKVECLQNRLKLIK